MNKTTVKEKVKNCLLNKCCVPKGSILVLGLSGGPDSLCLLYVLDELKTELDFSLCAFHLNHSIRPDADDDQRFLEKECKTLGIRLYTVKEDIAALAKANSLSCEDAGRRERHRLIREICDEQKKEAGGRADAFPVLAHNADDQAETVLLRMIRGTGIHGLSAMSYFREDGLCRPLLDCSRSEIEEYCSRHRLSPRIDSTNSSSDYTRNRIRLEVLPLLENINPAIKNSLIRLARNAGMDDQTLKCLSQHWYSEHIKSKDPEHPLFKLEDLRELYSGMRYRVIKSAFESIGLTEDIADVHIQALEKAIFSKAGGKTIEFPKKYTVYINHGMAEFRKPIQ